MQHADVVRASSYVQALAMLASYNADIVLANMSTYSNTYPLSDWVLKFVPEQRVMFHTLVT
jgi:hypothetical protein